MSEDKKITLYYSSVSGNLTIKKNQQKLQMMLEGLKVPFDMVDGLLLSLVSLFLLLFPLFFNLYSTVGHTIYNHKTSSLCLLPAAYSMR